MDGGAWWAVVHGVPKSQTQLSDFTFTFHFHALEKEMATHPSVLVWRIPGTGEPGGLPSMASHRVGHDWSNLAAAAGAVQRQVSKRGQNRDANLDPCALLSYILFVGSFVHLNKYLSFRLRFFFSTLGTVPICLPEKSLHRAAFKWWPLAAF